MNVGKQTRKNTECRGGVTSAILKLMLPIMGRQWSHWVYVSCRIEEKPPATTCACKTVLSELWHSCSIILHVYRLHQHVTDWQSI